jgi:RNA polymerase sigma factor (sigma-70 family)
MSTAAESPFATDLRPSLVRRHRVEDRPMTGEASRRSDEELVEAVARADEDALGELYDRFGKVAYGLAYKILQDATLAEDAVQEAFLQIWRGAGSYRPERAKASTWLLTFVHRRAVDLVRREQRRRTVQLDPLPEPSGSGADEEVVALSRREIVQDALRRLPAEQREAIELAYYGGLTQSELAAQLDQPLGTIKSRMFTGLQRLRVLLVEAGYEST